MPKRSEVQFGVVRAVGRGIAVLDGGQRIVQREGEFSWSDVFKLFVCIAEHVNGVISLFMLYGFSELMA